jgi:hypothetical protein
VRDDLFSLDAETNLQCVNYSKVRGRLSELFAASYADFHMLQGLIPNHAHRNSAFYTAPETSNAHWFRGASGVHCGGWAFAAPQREMIPRSRLRSLFLSRPEVRP